VRPLAWVVYVGNLLIVTFSWAPALYFVSPKKAPKVSGDLADIYPAATSNWILLALATGVLLAFVFEIRRYERPGGVTVNVAAAVFAMVYIGLLLTFLVQLRMSWGVGALASVIIVVKAGDIGAYTVGRLIGHYKMAPGVSPGKTMEGAIGAMVFSAAGSWATFWWLVPLLRYEGAPKGPWWGWILFGVLVGIAGMAGDLGESLIKRDVKRKDSSSWLPGFGGVLDILDSALFAAPVAYACWAFGLVGYG
jgi:phosphatidate cytidylyltransferase